jgi:endonuclease YncB( thermonuclease family)
MVFMAIDWMNVQYHRSSPCWEVARVFLSADTLPATAVIDARATHPSTPSHMLIRRLVATAFLVVSGHAAGAVPAIDPPERCLVVGIADGDTLTLRCGWVGAFRQVKVRLAEVDAPEKRQAYGQRSRQSLALLCFGAFATMRPEGKDRYKRTVARVECRGEDVSEAQARAGAAWFSKDYGKDPVVKVLADEARRERLGLWADPRPMPPWDWRRLQRQYQRANPSH